MKRAEIEGKRILITGATGQFAKPLVAAYAGKAQVFAAARYAKDEDRAEIAAMGATPVRIDLSDPASLSAIPEVEYVVNAAVAKTGDFDRDLARNAPQGLPLGSDKGGSVGCRVCQRLTETATANKGFAATRFDAPQHVDINAFADDGIQLLEVKRELEIDGKTRVLGWQSGGAARIEQFAKIGHAHAASAG